MTLFPDSEGTTLGGLNDARQWAFGLCPNTTRNIVPNESHRSIAIVVHDKDNRSLMTASMVFEVDGSSEALVHSLHLICRKFKGPADKAPFGQAFFDR
jgi:hypothetical protein